MGLEQPPLDLYRKRFEAIPMGEWKEASQARKHAAKQSEGVLRIQMRNSICALGSKNALFRAVAENAQNLASFWLIGRAYAPS